MMVRVKLLRSTGNFGNVGAEVELEIVKGESQTRSSKAQEEYRVVLTHAYESLSEWVGLAVEAENLQRRILDLAVLGKWDHAQDDAQTLDLPDHVVEARADLEKTRLRLAEVLVEMRGGA